MSEDPAVRTFKSQRLTLSYATWGREENPLLILVHGGLDQKRSWDWVANRLAKDYYVVAHDLRGHGQSEWANDGDYGVMDHVFDLASFVDHLDRDQFYLLGHSLGGNIALRYSGIFPDRIKKLVAIEGLGPSPKMLAERLATPVETRLLDWIDDRRKRSDRLPRQMKNFDEALTRMRTAHGHLSDEQLAHLTKTGLKTNEDGVQWAYDAAAMGRSPSDISYDEFLTLIGRIHAPIWLVYGDKSWASNPEKDGRAKHLRGAKVTSYKNAGHWLHHDSFDKFMADLVVFLGSAESDIA